jgi:hypothetical protein
MIAETSATISTLPRVFKDIKNKNCNIAIWRRQLSFDADILLISDPKSFRTVVRVDECHSLLQSAVVQAGYIEGAALTNLVNDISNLCKIFQPFVCTQEIELRLEVIDGDACRKFHSDFVTLRLISTYSGPGTQWLDSGGNQTGEGVEPNSINEMAPGEVGLFKGRLTTNDPVIHRSPPIKGTGKKRLVLVLNPYEGTD